MKPALAPAVLKPADFQNFDRNRSSFPSTTTARTARHPSHIITKSTQNPSTTFQHIQNRSQNASESSQGTNSSLAAAQTRSETNGVNYRPQPPPARHQLARLRPRRRKLARRPQRLVARRRSARRPGRRHTAPTSTRVRRRYLILIHHMDFISSSKLI